MKFTLISQLKVGKMTAKTPPKTVKNYLNIDFYPLYMTVFGHIKCLWEVIKCRYQHDMTKNGHIKKIPQIIDLKPFLFGHFRSYKKTSISSKTVCPIQNNIFHIQKSLLTPLYTSIGRTNCTLDFPVLLELWKHVYT